VKSVGILVAMWEELNPLRKHWQLEWTGPGDFFTGKVAGLRVQVALSGVGPRHAEKAIHHLVRQGQPELLISLGYSGALKEQLKPGDVFHGNEIESPGHKIFRNQQQGHRLLSVAKLAASKEKKLQLAQEHPEAYAVDMESLILAQAAEEAGIPWRALRVIIDPLHSDLPIDFDRCVNPKGQTAPVLLAQQILTRPLKFPALLQFGRWERKARGQLLLHSSQLLEAIQS